MLPFRPALFFGFDLRVALMARASYSHSSIIGFTKSRLAVVVAYGVVVRVIIPSDHQFYGEFGVYPDPL
jgi:hypothetical protein